MKDRNDKILPASTKDFKFKYIVGRGGFGKVWKVQRKKDSQIFAMKMLSKARILYKHSVYSVMNERRLLAHLNHGYYLYLKISFLVNMICAFQDIEYLYMVLDFMPGGDLRHYMIKQKSLTEEETSKLLII